MDLGIIKVRTGERMGVLKYHARSAFTLLADNTLTALCDAYGIDMDVFEKGGQARRDSQRLALLHRLEPKWSAADALHALEVGRDADCPEDTKDLQFLLDDIDLMDSVISRFEQNTWRTWATGQRKACEHHRHERKSLSEAVTKLAPFVALSVATAKPMASKPKHSAAARRRWVEKLKDGDFSGLEEFAPLGLRLVPEASSGCIRIIHDKKRIKSFAWQLRGKSIAQLEALMWAWEWAKDAQGIVNPFPWIFE